MSKPPKGKRFRLGISGNPRGRPREVGKLVSLMPREEFSEMVMVLFRGTVADIQKIARSGARSALQVLIARSLLRDFRRGDMKNLNRLLNHIIGKPVQVVEYMLTCRRCGVSAPLEAPLNRADNP